MVSQGKYISEKILIRSKSFILLAIFYELCRLIDPNQINVPILNRICETNMLGFYCVCRWEAAYNDENNTVAHMRTSQGPLIHKAIMELRKSQDKYEFE